jgi:PAS domain-containing protein
LRPYVTEDRIDGVIAILVDVEAIKRAQAYQESIVATTREPLLVLDADLRIRTANVAFLTAFQTTLDRTEGRLLYERGDGEWDIPELRELLERIHLDDKPISDFSIDRHFARSSQRCCASMQIASFKPTCSSSCCRSGRHRSRSHPARQRQRFKTMADNIAQFAWMADSKGWIFNRRWFEYTGTVLSDVQGDRWQRFHHPDHRQRVASMRRH